MQSPGPPYQGPSVVSSDIYVNRNYENHVLSSHGLSPNNYITYHTEGSHPSSYSGQQTHYNNSAQTSHAAHVAHSHYNSSNSQSYGQSVNHFNDMYACGSGRNVYAANIPPTIRQPIPTPNVKYWNSEQQMSQNSHNYNQGIPPPPLVSRTQGLSSPTLRSPHCNASNSYSVVTSHSPQGWSRSPNVMHSPSTTPSPLPSHPSHTSHNRSPSHLPSQQFSPPLTTHSGITDSSQQKSQVSGVSYSNQNHSSSQVNASNPLQSLQKMVMIETDSSEMRTTAYENIPSATLQNNGTVPLTPNLIQKSYNNDQNINNDPDSPYPTYYNLDQNRLCTPPRPSPASLPVHSFANIPETQTDGFVSSEAQLTKSENELKKDDSNDNKDNKAIDLIYPFEGNSGIDESKTETISENNAKVLAKTDDSVNSVNGENISEEVNKTDSSISNIENSSKKLSHESTQEQLTRGPPICKRTSSRDSLQSTDSETAHSAFTETRTPHNWQMNQMEKEYFANQSDNNKNMWWSQNNLTQTSQAMPQTNSLSPINSGISPGFMSECRPVPPSLTPVPSSMSYQSTHIQCGPEWAPSASSSHSSTPTLNTSNNKHFASPKSMRESLKKKRGRPFGSKNRRNSEDTGSETNVSDIPSPIKKRKKSIHTEEIGINTTVSIDQHGFDELAVVNPIKTASGSSKRKKTVGPFIRMEKGKGRKAILYSIVNTTTKQEDEKDVKTKSNFINTESIKHNRRPSLIGASKKVVSTLSPHYDLNTRDKTWICALCHKGPHFKGLGDLYGPYYVTAEEKVKPNQSITTVTTSINSTLNTICANPLYNSVNETIDSVVANEQSFSEKKVKNTSEKRRKSDNSDDGTNKRPKQTSKMINTVNTSQNVEIDSSLAHSQNSPIEVWIHEDCIVWSSGVYLVGHRIRNLEEIIIESNENICTKCKLSGATLGCLQKSCNTSQFHYLCAKEKGCDMDEENFSLYCPKHKKKKRDVLKSNCEEPSISTSAKL